MKLVGTMNKQRQPSRQRGIMAPMPKIRVDAEPLLLPVENMDGVFVPAGTDFEMPRIRGMEVDGTQRVRDQLTQPARLRCNRRDEHGSFYHLRLTRHEVFTIMVPVILAETDSPAGGITSRIGWRAV